MARKAGAPDNFSLKGMGIEKPEDEVEAVEIGDFLEEEDAPPAKVPKPKKKPTPQKSRENRSPVETEDATESSLSDEKPTERGSRRVRPLQRIRMPQVSIREETHDRLRELTALMVQYGPQQDLKGSEVLDALINALYDARKSLELQGVNRRGQWGSPQADAFLIQLKEAVIRTIEQYSDSRR